MKETQIMMDPEFDNPAMWTENVVSATASATVTGGKLVVGADFTGSVQCWGSTNSGYGALALKKGERYRYAFKTINVSALGTASVAIDNKIVWQWEDYTDPNGEWGGEFVASADRNQDVNFMKIGASFVGYFDVLYFYLWHQTGSGFKANVKEGPKSLEYAKKLSEEAEELIERDRAARTRKAQGLVVGMPDD